jgi:CHAT domain-containing protein
MLSKRFPLLLLISRVCRPSRRREAGRNQPAIIKLDTKAPFAHPHYWAPFILIGNWK